MIGPEEQEEAKVLPFDDTQQQAFLGFLVMNHEFFKQAQPYIKKSTYFGCPMTRLAYEVLEAFHKRSLREKRDEPHPKSFAELVSELKPDCNISDRKEYREPGFRRKIEVEFQQCEFQMKRFTLDGLKAGLSRWLKSNIYQHHSTQSWDYWNDRKQDAAIAAVESMVEEIKNISFGKNLRESFSNYKEELAMNNKEMGNGLTFGIQPIDEILGGEGCTGGLMRGDTTVIMAPTNMGKTTCLITVACENILQGKKVLFITHEGRKEDIKEKIQCNLLQITKAEQKRLYTSDDPELKYKRAAWEENFEKAVEANLFYMSLNGAGLTIEEVDPIIVSTIQSAKDRGINFDLLVDDYPACLTTVEASKGHMPRRLIDDKVYGYFVQYALTYGFHSLLAIQTNREGSKTNKYKVKGESNRLLTMEDAMESWGPMTKATNVITLNRDRSAGLKNRLTYYIDKSRSSETGWAVVCRTDFARATTHRNKLGSLRYNSSSSMNELIDNLLIRYGAGKEEFGHQALQPEDLP